MMQFRFVIPLLALMTCMTFAGAACGGEDEAEVAAEASRMDALEQRLSGIEGYIAGQVQAQQNGAAKTNGRVGDDLVAQPLYALDRENASDNEVSIVRWMAECTSDSYLNPELPPEVREREVGKVEAEMWNALAAGQYVSFEQFIGQAFSFCQAVILREGR